MRTTLQIVFTYLLFLNCQAQTPVFDIEDFESKDSIGAYHKDTKNVLDPFEGTYVYTSGNTTFKLVLQKKIMSNMNNYYYEDLIIGEYQYIENGVETRNTLAKLNENYSNKVKHSLFGNHILNGKYLGCKECADNEKRLKAGLVDYVADALANVQLRRITYNGKPAIVFNLYWEMRTKRDTDPPLTRPFIAPGDYIMIKQ